MFYTHFFPIFAGPDGQAPQGAGEAGGGKVRVFLTLINPSDVEEWHF